MKLTKVVLWGHKLHSHTHSYIHNGFYRAFKYLGYDTYWYDDDDDVHNIDFSQTLFITEHQVNKKIPCRQDCLYLSHYVDPSDFPNVPKENIIILKNSPRDFYESDKDYGKKYTYTVLPYNTKYEYHSYFDGYNCIYLYWATDLLPFEIDKNISSISNIHNGIGNEVHFVGHFTNIWNIFYNFCKKYNISFRQHGATFSIQHQNNKTIDENMELIQKSIIAPALQDEHQINMKYIPCRIFKNISYGKMGITNNPFVNELFDNKLLFNSNIETLLLEGINFENNPTKNTIIESLMIYVIDNHTYLNRINSIRSYIKDYTEFYL